MAIIPEDQRIRGGLALGSTVAGGTALGWATSMVTDLGGRQGVTPEVGGGVSGVGGVVALRETVDVLGGQQTTLVGEPGTTLGRLSRPSVAWGLGGGSLGALWWGLDAMTGVDMIPDLAADFGLWWGLTGIPAGLASALMPKQPTTSGGSTAAASASRRPLREATTDGGSSSDDSSFPA